MKDSRNWVQHCLDICSCVSLALAGLLVLQPALIAAADKGYESAPVLSASKILPPELLAGPNHHVEERVYNDGYLNRYTVNRSSADSSPWRRRCCENASTKSTPWCAWSRSRAPKNSPHRLKKQGPTRWWVLRILSANRS